jgi:hypothetical protein
MELPHDTQHNHQADSSHPKDSWPDKSDHSSFESLMAFFVAEMINKKLLTEIVADRPTFTQ